jgi:hypothetical protein
VREWLGRAASSTAKCQFMECFGMLFICEGQYRVNDVARQVRGHNKHGERNAERR